MPFTLESYSALGVEALLKPDFDGLPVPQMKQSEEMERLVMQKEAARLYHRSLPGYLETPLYSLPNLAESLGIKAVFIKDEAKRFGLNAFKALGASYAVARLIAKELKIEMPCDELTFSALTQSALRDEISRMTFVTATDGNHGRGLAWAAARLGAQAVIYMPKGSSAASVSNIESEGAQVIVTDLNYDETVLVAKREGEKNGWHLVQDTSWEGYRIIPDWIAAGYLTMADEIAEQLDALSLWPSHLFLQAGVGTMAGAMASFFAGYRHKEAPRISLMEPTRAACYFASMLANDGSPHTVGGDLETIMKGLSCGVPNSRMYPVLRDICADYFSCPDYVAARGMRLAASPQGEDPRFVSGESGAVGLGLLSLLCERPEYAELRQKMGLNESSVVLLLSTEGDTDPVTYRKVVYDGAYATPD